MKTIKMNLNSEPFEKIKNGSKIYELRLYDEKRRAIDVGDKIIFECRGGTCVTVVTAMVIAPTFRDLFNIVPMRFCGYVDGDGYTAEKNGMDKYYSRAEQLMYHVVAIRVKRK